MQAALGDVHLWMSAAGATCNPNCNPAWLAIIVHDGTLTNEQRESSHVLAVSLCPGSARRGTALYASNGPVGAGCRPDQDHLVIGPAADLRL